jgi:hypothetical protein
VLDVVFDGDGFIGMLMVDMEDMSSPASAQEAYAPVAPHSAARMRKRFIEFLLG